MPIVPFAPRELMAAVQQRPRLSMFELRLVATVQVLADQLVASVVAPEPPEDAPPPETQH